ncbi:hypothetical protein [Mesorhizobium sp. B2-5-4]|uniref:hypothetical protein n=1 Tax=Mesorhizobium sp. B2-5-4 TaxID=2589926 RepID=UPI001FEF2B8C|nr:hypothetical protein [Mesorhizobium sp. B2-5-4]
MALTRTPFRRFLRNLVLGFVNINPIAKRKISLKLSGLSRADMAKLPAPSQSGVRKQSTKSGLKLVA